jgi:ABC-2 type transport system ATP-binding protein
MAIVECYGLRKVFQNVVAVNDISFTMEEGDILGFIGPNGAGKTTTIKMLVTLLRPDAGQARIAGMDVLRQQDEVRRVIGYMPDFFGVYDDIKVWEYLDFFAAAYKIERSRRPQIIDDVLALTDLGGKKEAFVEELSRGMKQRLCLAKTLLHDPQVLFLDEPASGLDPRARIEIRELLKALRNLGKTILISSHILTELADFVTKVAIIEAGNMVVTGSVADIMAQLEPFKRVHVTVDSDVDHACRVLETIEGVHNVRATDHRIELEYHGEGTQFALILPELIHAGVVVTGFGESEANLEEIFMRVTQGIVQ